MKTASTQCWLADKIEPLLPDFIQNQLAPDRKRIVSVHLDGCPFCRARAAEYRRTLELVAVDAVPEIDGERMLLDIRRKVRLALPAARSQPAWFGLGIRRWVPILAATATIMIAVLVFRPGTRAPGFDSELAALLVDSDDNGYDPLSTDSSDLPALTIASTETVEEVETTLIENGDLDDMFDDLSTEEQNELVDAMENLFRSGRG